MGALECLDRFGQEAPHTRIEVIETVIGGAPEALLERRVDLRHPAPDTEAAREDALLLAVLAGFPDRVARRRRPHAPEVLLASLHERLVALRTCHADRCRAIENEPIPTG